MRMEGYEVIRETERNGRLQKKDGKERKRRGENTWMSRMGKRGRNGQGEKKGE